MSLGFLSFLDFLADIGAQTRRPGLTGRFEVDIMEMKMDMMGINGYDGYDGYKIIGELVGSGSFVCVYIDVIRCDYSPSIRLQCVVEKSVCPLVSVCSMCISGFLCVFLCVF